MSHESNNGSIPTKVASLKRIISVQPGYFHCLALDQAGQVFSAGNNRSGELGYHLQNRENGTRKNESDTFKKVGFPEKLKINAIAAGNGVSFAIGKDDNLYSWGN